MQSQIVMVFLTLCFLLPGLALSQEKGTPPAEATQSQALPSQVAKVLHVSGDVMLTSTIKTPLPKYPSIAKSAGVSGNVVLHVIVGKDGLVTDVSVISGPPMLLRAAMDAMKKWRFQGTLSNGEQVVVDTSFTLVFVLNHSPEVSIYVSPKAPANSTP